MKIESFEKACEIAGHDPASLPDVSKLPTKHQQAQISSFKLFIISEASWKGDGKTINWNSRSQKKWSPLWWMDEPGFRFGGSLFGLTLTGSAGGSRLCYPSKGDSDYHAEQHFDLYRNLMVLPKE